MERKLKRNNGYIEGNAVRHIRPLPEDEELYRRRREKEYREREFEKRRRREQQQIEHFYRMDFISFAFLFIGLIAVFVLCCSIVSSQSAVTQMKKSIAAKEIELSQLQKQNDSDLAEINASIDLTKIYKKATKKLGMVHASENQVIEYDSTKSDYVRQYGSIRKSTAD